MIVGERMMKALKHVLKFLFLTVVLFTVFNIAWSQTPIIEAQTPTVEAQTPIIEDGDEFRLFAPDLLTPKGMARVRANQLIFDVPLQSGEQLSLIINHPDTGELLSYNVLVGIDANDLLVDIPGHGFVSLKTTLLEQNVRLALPGTP